MEAIIKVHCYEDFEKNFVEGWKNHEYCKFDLGKVGFWFYTIELSGNKLLCYKKNSNNLGKSVLFVKNDVKNISEDDFESILYEAHLETLCSMIYLERMGE